MPINPITLDKKDPLIIKKIEQRVVERIVHEARGAEIRKEQDNKNHSFNQEKQEREVQKLGQYLYGFNLKLEHKVKKNRTRIRIIDRDGNLLIDTEIEDVESLHNAIKKETGAIIDMKG
jgi:hypothetical protein